MTAPADITTQTSTASGCCDGAARPATDVRIGISLAAATSGISHALREADAWPYLLPAWLAATERSLAEAEPWHSVARSGADAVLIPGFVFDGPGLVDADPRTYLGWEPRSGQAACCSVSTGAGTQDLVEALGTEMFFPALVLGSPLGYRSDAVVVGEQNTELTMALVDQLVEKAKADGIRSIVAPWVSDRPVNGPLLASLHNNGATVSFGGQENFLPLEHSSYEDYLASLTSRRRQRVKQDEGKAIASGVRITRLDGEGLRPLTKRIAELTIMNRQKYDGSESAEHISELLTALVDDGADVRAYVAYLNDTVVASTVTIRQGKRLMLKWAGFDYAALGERSGLYFPLVLDRPLQDALAEGLESVETGPGADEAKRLRGYQPRSIYTAVWVADVSAREQVAALQGVYGGARRAALATGAAAADEPSAAARALSRFRKKPAADGCCG
jgi:predicted N-acyltransferase